MSCCGTGAELAMLAATDTREILLACRPIAGNLRQTDLSVPDVHCGACIHTVEKALGALEGVGSARVNLSTKRVTIKRRADIGTPPDFIETLRNVGYEAHLFEVDSDARDGTASRTDPRPRGVRLCGRHAQSHRPFGHQGSNRCE